MTFKLTVFFVLMWAGMALITASMEKQDTIQGTEFGASFGNLTNTIGDPDSVTASSPTLGSNEAEFSGTINFASPREFLGFMGEVTGLKSSLWEPWTAPIRLIISALTMVFTFMVAKELFQMLGGLLSGVGGLLGRAF